MHGATIKNSAHSLFECEDLGTRGRTYLGSFFLDPEDVRNLNLGAIWNFIKRTGFPRLRHQRAFQMLSWIGTEWARTHLFYSILLS
jgi:hypothetical protein